MGGWEKVQKEMRIYIAGNEEGVSVYRAGFIRDRRVPSLWSYYKFRLGTVKPRILGLGKSADLFLDSGAFSAFSKGITIDLPEYVHFVQDHLELLKHYSVLDVIGDAEGTYRNQRRMEEAGLSPLPCFHYGEDEKWLVRYLKEGYQYISLGGMVPISARALQAWLRRLFSKYLCDEEGVPKVKVHGFGLSTLSLLKEFPWYSVDSTSWLSAGIAGSILCPSKRSGRLDFSVPFQIGVLAQPKRPRTGAHYQGLAPDSLRRRMVDEWLESIGIHMGRSRFESGPIGRRGEVVEEEGVCNSYRARDLANICYYLKLAESLPSWPWPYRRISQARFGV